MTETRSARLRYEPLALHHGDALADALLNDAVYRHIGGLPARERFDRGIASAVAGPRPEHACQHWLNFAVRLADSGLVVGRLEATLHDGIAEVAFLFDPRHWGRGYATEGLRWLHDLIDRDHGAPPCWATTVPANTECQALLARCGYESVLPATAPRLLSYDDGDLVYRRSR